jgi:ABC-type sugar transport system ATPase subunit
MSDKPLRVENVSLSFGTVGVFQNLSVDIEHGEFVAVVGPSGCGKTTLLNLFSQFLKPSSGRVVCAAGREWFISTTVFSHGKRLVKTLPLV